MKSLAAAVVFTVLVASASVVLASPEVDSYIRAIANLPGVHATLPKAPRGCGAMRDDGTGNFVLLLPQDYCDSQQSAYLYLGTTTYGGQIEALCPDVK